MRIAFEGREWEFDLEAITIKQAIAVHLAYGFNLDAWFEALGDTDPRALQCLWWLILQQDGQVMPLTDADCSLIELSVAFADAQEEPEAEAEPDPTPPSPPSPPAGPPSPGPSTRTATTRPRPARRRLATAESTPPI